jgi:hypothetical protein
MGEEEKIGRKRTREGVGREGRKGMDGPPMSPQLSGA